MGIQLNDTGATYTVLGSDGDQELFLVNQLQLGPEVQSNLIYLLLTRFASCN